MFQEMKTTLNSRWRLKKCLSVTKLATSRDGPNLLSDLTADGKSREAYFSPNVTSNEFFGRIQTELVFADYKRSSIRSDYVP